MFPYRGRLAYRGLEGNPYRGRGATIAFCCCQSFGSTHAPWRDPPYRGESSLAEYGNPLLLAVPLPEDLHRLVDVLMDEEVFHTSSDGFLERLQAFGYVGTGDVRLVIEDNPFAF